MSAPASRWDRWLALSPLQRGALLQAWCLMPLAWLGLRRWGLPRLHAWLQADPPARVAPNAAALALARELGEATNIAARHTPFSATCLSRSLLLLWMLRRRGMAGELRIGVRLQAGTLTAHAWVEYAGQPVNDRPDVAQQYAPFHDLHQALAFDAA
jgi:hypothetical protein